MLSLIKKMATKEERRQRNYLVRVESNTESAQNRFEWTGRRRMRTKLSRKKDKVIRTKLRH